MSIHLQAIRRIIVGDRLPTARAIHERLPKFLALPVFGSDAISSSAYATEEILLALIFAGSVALGYSIYVALAITLLFVIVAISYRQTVIAYPSGGGAYIVARENLGLFPGIIAAAALLTDYVLTVAVSIAAGVAAIVSAVPELATHRVELGILFIAIITLANLRGAKESGWLFAGPTYLFVAISFSMIVVGALRLVLGYQPPPMPIVEGHHPLTLFLLMKAFASGCAALTGTEAISNGVPAFRPPESKNAATTLVIMICICITLFLGITFLTQAYHLAPIEGSHETIISMLGRAVFGSGPLYYLLQIATMAILVLAANTSFVDFPRLSSILSRDRLAPRQLTNLGDRLVFNNGIIVLALLSAALLVAFGGMTHRLIPLYAVGVFISFTLSQAGMVVHWRKEQSKDWKIKAVVNAVGAAATFIVLLVVGSVKFLGGAWIIFLIIPILVLGFLKINKHYEFLRSVLTIKGYQAPRTIHHAVIVLVPSLHRGVVNALVYAKSLSTDPEAVFVEIDPAETKIVQDLWQQLPLGVPLTILKSPWRSLLEPIIQYIHTIRTERGLDMVTVILPEFATTRWWHKLLHNQSSLMLKFSLMFEPGVVVSNVRYHVGDEGSEGSWSLRCWIAGILRVVMRRFLVR